MGQRKKKGVVICGQDTKRSLWYWLLRSKHSSLKYRALGQEKSPPFCSVLIRTKRGTVRSSRWRPETVVSRKGSPAAEGPIGRSRGVKMHGYLELGKIWARRSDPARMEGNLGSCVDGEKKNTERKWRRGGSKQSTARRGFFIKHLGEGGIEAEDG